LHVLKLAILSAGLLWLATLCPRPAHAAPLEPQAHFGFSEFAAQTLPVSIEAPTATPTQVPLELTTTPVQPSTPTMTPTTTFTPTATLTPFPTATPTPRVIVVIPTEPFGPLLPPPPQFIPPPPPPLLVPNGGVPGFGAPLQRTSVPVASAISAYSEVPTIPEASPFMLLGGSIAAVALLASWRRGR
jgi:hypothetical protein